MVLAALAAACLFAAGGVLLETRLSPRFLAGAPPRPLAVGLISATAGGAITAALDAGAELPAYAVLVVAGVVLARIDIAVHRLPNVLTRGTLALGVILLSLAALVGSEPRRMLGALLGAVGLYLIYAFVALVNRAGMGRGDVKLAPVLGLYSGWLGLQAWEVTAIGGFLIQGALALGLLLARRVDRRSEIAHGPAMLLATLAAVLAAPALATAYVGVLGGGS